MFYCLLENALNFSRPDVSPVIKIFTENCQPSDLLDLNAIPAVEYCKICIVDNGIGIESSYLRLIFDLFSKLNPRREFEGLGMGLSQSKRIVANHNGAILVQSQLNVGSQFSIILPVNRVAPEPKSLNEVATKETMLSRVSQ
jgi:signal transduction histidine kinase